LWTEFYFASRPGIKSSIIMPSVAVSRPPEHTKYIASTLAQFALAVNIHYFVKNGLAIQLSLFHTFSFMVLTPLEVT